ncbi:hypothetical protein [Paenibacillus lacisoli]
MTKSSSLFEGAAAFEFTHILKWLAGSGQIFIKPIPGFSNSLFHPHLNHCPKRILGSKPGTVHDLGLSRADVLEGDGNRGIDDSCCEKAQAEGWIFEG